MRRLNPFRRHDGPRTKGQSLVEFALILPIFLLLVAGALDLGRVFYANISLNNAAREGAFQASQTPDSYAANQPCNTATNMIICRVLLESKDSAVAIQPGDVSMTCSEPGCPKEAGSMVTVDVHGTFTLVTPLLSSIFGGQTIQLHSSATAQVEYLPDPVTATVPPSPVADFSGSPRTGVASSCTTVTFTDLSTGTVTGWNWDFGDGGTSTLQNPTHDYCSAGSYTVVLTVINLGGVDSETKTAYIVIDPAPTATPTAGPTATPTATPVPTASCGNPPNVIGETPASAVADLNNAGFHNVQSYGDLTTGTKNKVQAMNPDYTQCLAFTTLITIHWRPS
jgi:hypothetical protein